MAQPPQTYGTTAYNNVPAAFPQTSFPCYISTTTPYQREIDRCISIKKAVIITACALGGIIAFGAAIYFLKYNNFYNLGA